MYILVIILMELLVLFIIFSLLLVICQHETDSNEEFLASPETFMGGTKVLVTQKQRENNSEDPLQGIPTTYGEHFLRSPSTSIETTYSQGLFGETDMRMNTNIDDNKQGEMKARKSRIPTDREWLVDCGFDSDEIVSLLWLQNWYQSGGSDRVVLVRHWEFLRLLVRQGKLDL